TDRATITITGAGTCSVTASQAGNGNYNPGTDVARNFTINQATATINVVGYTGVYDGHAHGASGTASGVGGEDLNGLLNFGATFVEAPGGTAHWAFSGNTNYAPATGDVSIVLTQALASVTVNSYAGIYDGHPHGATGTASGVNGEDLSGLLNLGAQFTGVPGGTAHWSFSGNNNYATRNGDASISISQASATIVINGYSGVYDGNAHGASGSAIGVNGEDLNGLLKLGASFPGVPGR